MLFSDRPWTDVTCSCISCRTSSLGSRWATGALSRPHPTSVASAPVTISRRQRMGASPTPTPLAQERERLQERPDLRVGERLRLDHPQGHGPRPVGRPVEAVYALPVLRVPSAELQPPHITKRDVA